MAKKKVFYFISVFCIIFLTITGINVRAHPPDDMALYYDSGTDTLQVTITHGVSDRFNHYISSVQIKVNGSVNQTQYYGSQPDNNVFFYLYSLTTNNESIIQVTAVCIVGGSLTKTLGESNAPNGGIPGYIGLYLVLVVSVITLLSLYRKKVKIKTKN